MFEVTPVRQCHVQTQNGSSDVSEAEVTALGDHPDSQAVGAQGQRCRHFTSPFTSCTSQPVASFPPQLVLTCCLPADLQSRAGPALEGCSEILALQEARSGPAPR